MSSEPQHITKKERQGRQRWYRKRWKRPQHPAIGIELRRRFNNDYRAYLACEHKFCWTDVEIEMFQEEGMEYFVWLERGLLKRTLWRDYKVVGNNTLDEFLTAMCTDERTPTPESDFILAAIDFEGSELDIGGIHGYGITTLDTRIALTRDTSPVLTAHNFRAARHNVGFLFGDTKLIDQQHLRPLVLDSLDFRDDDNEQRPTRKIILICHELSAEFRNFGTLHIDIERDLPGIVGLIDTAEIGRRHLGLFPSLRTMVEWLRIPHRRDLFHCAGNDAMFTMQALLAMMYRRSKVMSSAWPALELHGLAYQELDIPVREKNVEEDWEDHLVEEGDSGMELWG